MIVFEFKCRVSEDGSFKVPGLSIENHCISHNNYWEAVKAYRVAKRGGCSIPETRQNINYLPKGLEVLKGGYISKFKLTLGG